MVKKNRGTEVTERYVRKLTLKDMLESLKDSKDLDVIKIGEDLDMI